MHLSQFKLTSASLLLLMGACASLPFVRSANEVTKDESGPTSHQEAPAQATLELQNMQYDGEYLSGRLLVGVTEGRLTMDKRLIEHVSVQVESVTDCVTSQPVGYVETDSFPQPASEEDLLTLTPGYWYGADVRFFLFDEKLTGEKAPACIEVGLLLRAESRNVAARSRVRAERHTPPSPEAGSTHASGEEGGVGAPDAG
jgi:hypothetical protein